MKEIAEMKNDELLNELARCAIGREPISPSVNEILAKIERHSAIRSESSQAKVRRFIELALAVEMHKQEGLNLVSQYARAKRLKTECSTAKKELLIHMRVQNLTPITKNRTLIGPR